MVNIDQVKRLVKHLFMISALIIQLGKIKERLLWKFIKTILKQVNVKVNRMKLRILILIFVMSVMQVSGQDKSIIKYINNDSIKFELLMTMPDFENGVYHSDYILAVNNIDSIGHGLIKQINRNQWMRLLKDSKSDWAANIILYSMYKRSAGIFRVAVKTRDNWVENNMKADIAYWDSFLKKH